MFIQRLTAYFVAFPDLDTKTLKKENTKKKGERLFSSFFIYIAADKFLHSYLWPVTCI